MSPRHRRQAPLPALGFTRPAAIDDTGLEFTMLGEDGGVERIYRFHDMPGSVELRRELVRSVGRLCGPGKRWRAQDSSNRAFYATRAFLDFACARPDPPQSAADLTAVLLDAWRDSQASDVGRKKHLSYMRHVLLNTDGISPQAVQALRKSVGRTSPDKLQDSYSLIEFGAIKSQAHAVFRVALQRIRSNRDHLGRWYAGDFASGTPEDVIGEALDCVLRTGDVPRHAHRPGRNLRKRYVTALGGGAPEQTWGRLFLTNAELFALAILLVASEGWNRAVIDKMPVPSHQPAAADQFTIHMVEVDKRRRPVHLRHTSNNLIDDGPDSPGRLIGQAIEATELARQSLALQGITSDRLLVCRSQSLNATHNGFHLGVATTAARSFTRQVSGAANVSLAKLRRTVLVRISGEPAQNSQAVHDNVYVKRDTSSIDAAAVTVAQGLTQALDHARTITSLKVILGGDADILVELADRPRLAAAVIAGQADTATAACTDFTNSPHAAPGIPCPASFLSCLGCGNAIATRRHLPRLCYLHGCLESLRSTLPGTVWQLDWHEHHLRLTTLLETHTTLAERQHHLRGLSGHDRHLIDALLRRRLDT